MVTETDIKQSSILIVDDNEDNVFFLQQLLERDGYEHIRSTMDPCEVLALTETEEPDLILLDLLMPRMSGFDVIAQLRSKQILDPYLPILVLTADTTTESKRKALARGAMDFLVKPLDAKEVLLRTRNLLKTRSLHRRQQIYGKQLTQVVKQRDHALVEAKKKMRKLHHVLEEVSLEQELAAKIWRSVVPEIIHPVEHYQCQLFSRPAKHVGGDFHMSHHDWVVVGDVCGKGVPAALLTGMFIAALKPALRHPDPGSALEQVLINELESSAMFATMAAVKLSPDGKVGYLNFGHPPILVLRRDQASVETLTATAPPIGTFPQASYPMRQIQLQPGDMLCLYSDGLSEAQRTSPNGERELFGMKRMQTVLTQHHHAEVAVQRLLKALEGWRVEDDLTLVLLQYCPETR
jgi:serine phosphatase RsbU (regulator of sigma subunit)